MREMTSFLFIIEWKKYLYCFVVCLNEKITFVGFLIRCSYDCEAAQEHCDTTEPSQFNLLQALNPQKFGSFRVIRKEPS